MSRRIDIELTSQTGEGSWTWRAAGARQPKGIVGAALVPPGETVGAVLRADIDVGLEGIEILSLDGDEARSLPGEGGGADRGQGHPQAGAGRVGRSSPRAPASGDATTTASAGSVGVAVAACGIATARAAARRA